MINSKQSKSKRNLLRLAWAFGLPFAAGAVGSVFTAPAIPTWYAALKKPPFNPPNLIFGPVWSILYILLGIVLYRLLEMKGPKSQVTGILRYFYIQLFLNALWSICFFGAKSPFLAFLTIVILLYFAAILLLRLEKADKTGALLFTPYFLWISFAAILNYSVWLLNTP